MNLNSLCRFMDYGECMQRESGKLSSLGMNESFFQCKAMLNDE